MSKMGEKNDVEWCVRFGRWVVLFSISFIFFSTPVFSKNNIPNVCIPRGVELGILNPSSTSTKPLLQKNAYDVVPTVEKYYHQTLDRLKDEVQDEESQIFSYLMKCAASKNGRECHHFYKQKNNDPDFYIENNIFYLDTYCAPQIAQFVVQTAVTTTEKMQEQCSTQPEFIEADDEGGFPENAIPDCFGRDTISGASYWTNKTVEYEQRLENLRSRTPDAYALQTIKQSLIPEATDFILRKSKEEFENLKSRADINDFLHSYYAYADMLGDLSTFSNANLQPDYEVSAANVNTLADMIKNKMPEPKFLTFQLFDAVSKELFHQATLNYWKNKTKNQSPMQLSEEDQWSYFVALQADPMLYLDSDSDGFEKVKENLRANFPVVTTYDKSQMYGEVTPYTPSESTRVPFVDPDAKKIQNNKDFYYRFFADSNYRNDFMAGYGGSKRQEFEKYKKEFSPVFLRAFLPYAAARTVRVKLLRELQKRNDIKTLLASENSFAVWAELTICRNWVRGPAFYCGSRYEQVRKKNYKNLHSEIKENRTKINQDSAKLTAPRKYIYDEAFVQNLNKNLFKINSYCQQQANPKAYQSVPQQFDASVLDSMINNLYSIPRINELLDKEVFLKTVRADPGNYKDSCFTKGKLFGQDLIYSDEMQKRMHTSKGKGQLVSNGRYGYQGDVYPTAQEAAQGLTFQQIYATSSFQIAKSDIERMEEKIEQTLSDEIAEIQEASSFVDVNGHVNVDNAKVQKFLHDSVIKRLPAMMDYALDNPSQRLGWMFVDWIETGSISEKNQMERLSLITNGLLILGTVIPIAKAPSLAAQSGVNAILLSTGGIAMTLTTVSVGSAIYQLYLLNQRQLIAERASLIGNLFPGQAQYLKKSYDATKKSAYTEIAWAVGLTVVFAAKPVISTMKFTSSYLTDPAFQLAWKSRGVELENFVRQASHETKYIFGKEFTDLVRDRRILSNQKFEELMEAFYKGDYETALKKNLGSKLDELNLKLKITNPENRLTPKEIYGQKIIINLVAVNPTMLQSTANAVKYPFQQASKTLANQEWVYSLKGLYMQYIRQNLNPLQWRGMSDKYRYNWEKSLVSFLDEARTSEKGAATFSKKYIDEISPQLKYFEFSKGVFVLKSDPNLVEMLGRLNLRSDLYLFLKPALQGELLSKEKVDIILANFHRPLETIGDCKAFLKAIKYINRDFSGWNIVTKASVNFSKRTNTLLTKIDDFYDWAKFKRYESHIRIVRFIRENKAAWNLTDDEIHDIIQKYDRNFDYKLRNSDEYFDKANQYVGEKGKIMQTVLQEEDLGPFLREETAINNNFHDDFVKDLNKGQGFETSFSNAIDKTRIYKNVHNECSLPNSVARKKIDQQYVNYALAISIASSFFSYMWHHYDEDKNMEWYSRILYDMAVPTVLSRWQALKFTGGAQTTLAKVLIIPATSLKVFSVDAVGYNWLTNGLWSKNSAQNEFARQLYQSQNVTEMTENYLADHPEIEQEIAAQGQKLEAIFNQFQDRDIEGIPDDQIISEFINSKLIDEYTYEGMKKQDAELGENYVYHELMQKNVITPDMFPDPSLDSQEQLLRAIKDRMYDDLYENKNTNINLPAFGSVDIGDWWEIDSRDRAVLDQSPLSPEATDRFIFNMMETTATAPLVFARSQWVYGVLCRQRFLPGKLGLVSPLLIHAAYKAIMEPTKYVAREQLTGH